MVELCNQPRKDRHFAIKYQDGISIDIVAYHEPTNKLIRRRGRFFIKTHSWNLAEFSISGLELGRH